MAEKDNGQTGTMLPVSVSEVKRELDQYEEMIRTILKSGRDYDKLPGTNKETLLKPGAEKLCRRERLRPKFELLEKKEGWDEALFYYRYLCTLIAKDGQSGEDRLVAQCEGSCNSMESKYRWRWVWPNEVPAGIDKGTLIKKEGTSSTGKPYTRYRIPNDDIFSQVNTLQKMAQKRAYVGATLLATATSDRFTQDMEDLTPSQAKSETKKPQNKPETKKADDKGLMADQQKKAIENMLEFIDPVEALYSVKIRQKLDDNPTYKEAATLIVEVSKKLNSLKVAGKIKQQKLKV